MKEAVASAVENIQRAITNISPSIIEFNQKLNSSLHPFSEQLEYEIEKSIRKYPNSLKMLAEYGWYWPFFDFPPTINSKNVNEVDEMMVALIKDNITKIEDDLINEFSHRAKPITAAIKAHKKKEYDLSIPVFFAQTDGICKELIGRNFFGADRSNGFKPYTYAWTEQFRAFSILGILTEPLKHKGGLNKHHSEDNLIGITRHSVLHGESSDYGNALNSNKALSLLYYVGYIVHKVKENIESESN